MHAKAKAKAVAVVALVVRDRQDPCRGIMYSLLGSSLPSLRRSAHAPSNTCKTAEWTKRAMELQT